MIIASAICTDMRSSMQSAQWIRSAHLETVGGVLLAEKFSRSQIAPTRSEQDNLVAL
jgi:hypothetical protein